MKKEQTKQTKEKTCKHVWLHCGKSAAGIWEVFVCKKCLEKKFV